MIFVPKWSLHTLQSDLCFVCVFHAIQFDFYLLGHALASLLAVSPFLAGRYAVVQSFICPRYTYSSAFTSVTVGSASHGRTFFFFEYHSKINQSLLFVITTLSRTWDVGYDSVVHGLRLQSLPTLAVPSAVLCDPLSPSFYDNYKFVCSLICQAASTYSHQNLRSHHGNPSPYCLVPGRGATVPFLFEHGVSHF